MDIARLRILSNPRVWIASGIADIRSPPTLKLIVLEALMIFTIVLGSRPISSDRSLMDIEEA